MDTQSLQKEIKYRSTRSSGSGGQHVNKVSTKVELAFDVQASKSLNDQEKALLNEKLSNRINSEGLLLLSDQSSRSQFLNRKKVYQRFLKLIQQALAPPTPRSGPPRLKPNRKKRLDHKKRLSEKKSNRKKIQWD